MLKRENYLLCVSSSVSHLCSSLHVHESTNLCTLYTVTSVDYSPLVTTSLLTPRKRDRKDDK